VEHHRLIKIRHYFQRYLCSKIISDPSGGLLLSRVKIIPATKISGDHHVLNNSLTYAITQEKKQHVRTATILEQILVHVVSPEENRPLTHGILQKLAGKTKIEHFVG
jgi:hypothetical protein